jgi:hypothetical protein
VYIQSSGPVVTPGSCWEAPQSGRRVWHIGLYALSLCVKCVSRRFVQEPCSLRGHHAGSFPSFLPPSPSGFTYFPAFVSSAYKRDLAKRKRKRKNKKEKNRKHLVGHLRPRPPCSSPAPVSSPPPISAPSILFSHRTSLLRASSIPPLFSPACSPSLLYLLLSISLYYLFFFFFFFFLCLANGGSVMLLRQVCQCSPACV